MTVTDADIDELIVLEDAMIRSREGHYALLRRDRADTSESRRRQRQADIRASETRLVTAKRAWGARANAIAGELDERNGANVMRRLVRLRRVATNRPEPERDLSRPFREQRRAAHLARIAADAERRDG